MDGQVQAGLGSKIDVATAHPARRYDYWLGGKDNFPADRQSGDEIAAVKPSVWLWARENRAYLQRVVTYLTEEAGIRQFLDVGTGLPTANNTHEVAQSLAPESKVVYVDNDPLVLVHARALLTSSAEGATSYIEADLRRPGEILADPELTRVLDLSEPVALLLFAIVHFVPDEDGDPYEMVRHLVDALPSGSYLAMSHVTADFLPPQDEDALLGISQRQRDPFVMRSRNQVAAFFGGLELVDPGVAIISEWRRPETDALPDPADIGCYGAVARKP